jgi:hypothetical protein
MEVRVNEKTLKEPGVEAVARNLALTTHPPSPESKTLRFISGSSR